MPNSEKKSERSTLAHLIYISSCFEKKGFSVKHSALFYAVERVRLAGRAPRLRDLTVETNYSKAEVVPLIDDLTDAHILSSKVPKYGDPDDLVYGIGSVGGKLIKGLLGR